MVKHIRSLDDFYTTDTWLTIGSFDGVHIGHREIILQLTASAHKHGKQAGVVTFFPHPQVVLKNREDAFYLTTPDERALLLGGLGIDIVLTQEFNLQVARLSARKFILNLKSHFGMQQLWVGHDFALGRNREGDVDKLSELGGEVGFVVNVLKPVEVNGQVVSSSLIRSFLREGRIKEANHLLGRQYQLAGRVIKGEGRGRSIGVPTANIEPGNIKLIPANGVYACIVAIHNQVYPAATNIGYRPTFDGKSIRPHVESHLINFHRDLYGEELEIRFISRLRAEQKFNSVEDLINQIKEDIKNTKNIVEKHILAKTK